MFDRTHFAWSSASRRAADVNPYAPPSAGLQGGSVLVNPHESQVMVECVRRGWLCRKLRLFGRVEGEIEWDAGGAIETIRVCGDTAVSLCPFWYAPRFDFQLKSERWTIPARIEVRLTRFLPIGLRAFRLIVEQRVVYEEGTWQTSALARRNTIGDVHNGSAARPR